jgi:hypothetical protein
VYAHLTSLAIYRLVFTLRALTIAGSVVILLLNLDNLMGEYAHRFMYGFPVSAAFFFAPFLVWEATKNEARNTSK